MIKIDQIGVGIQVANFEGLGSPQGARGLIRGLQICELYFDNILIPYTKGFFEILISDLRQFFDRNTDFMLRLNMTHKKTKSDRNKVRF